MILLILNMVGYHHHIIIRKKCVW